MDYYALKREKRPAFGKELQAFWLNSMPAFQAKKGAGRFNKKEFTADAA
jgi:hypothetical protein